MSSLFVGRERDLAHLSSLLEPDGPVVHALHAPGGVGKTTLARAFQRQAEAAGARVAWADAAVAGTTVDALQAAWATDLGHDDFAGLSEVTILVLDSFEQVEGLEGWLRDRFMRSVGCGVRLVLVGRRAPSALWTTAPDWIGRIGVTRVACWDPPEAREYLRRRNVDGPEHQHALDASHGHPLALALLADVHQQEGSQRSLGWADNPSLVSHLVEKLCGSIRDPRRRCALAVAAEARVTTQGLLEVLVPVEDGYDLFEWMRGLSFMRAHPHGLVPHDLVRELLRYEASWRDPDRMNDLVGALRQHYLRAFQAAVDKQRELEALRDLAFVHRHHPMTRELMRFDPDRALSPEPGVDADLPAVRAMLAEHGLAACVSALEYWHEAQPGSLVVIRDRSGTVLGCELAIRVTEEGLARAEPYDAAAPTIRDALRRRDGLRGDEYAFVGRVWCTRDGQVVNDVQSQLWINRVRECIRAAGLAHMMAYFADPTLFGPAFLYMGFERAEDADVDAAGEVQGAYIRDWRRESPAQWFVRMSQLVSGQAQPIVRPPDIQTAVVLSATAFADAVKRALRVYPSRTELARSPLAQSRFVVERAADVAGGRAEALAQLIEEACDVVRLNPSARKAYRALYRTIVRPAATQREAAELESMAFGTFRRHLAVGIDRVTEHLWRLETEPG